MTQEEMVQLKNFTEARNAIMREIQTYTPQRDELVKNMKDLADSITQANSDLEKIKDEVKFIQTNIISLLADLEARIKSIK